ncbi:MAG TPA: hypothetical protein VN924_18720 [Bryobacteraceae bacterium]|nr:hypothetical protein [Bryobacteraceae bacterium]
MGKTVFAGELAALDVVLGALEPLDEDARLFVFRTAMDRPGVNDLPKAGSSTLGKSGGSDNGAGLGAQPDLTRMTPKEFIRLKQPITDVQRVACLAYFLARSRGIAEFKTLDLTKLNTEAAGVKFSNTAVAVSNATLTGFLAPAGGGKKQITALGEDIVDALPDQERVKAPFATLKKPRRRKVAKKIPKKG